MQQTYDKEQLICKGVISHLSAKKHFSLFKDRLYTKEWVVNIQAPFGSPEKVLEYLSRYVFRVAITNRRIIEMCDGKVLFSWKDYRRNGSYRKMKLDIDEFIRRFLLHILPKGFLKVRYYGIFASRYRSEAITRSRQLLELEKQEKIAEAIEDGYLISEKQSGIWEEIKKMMHDYKKPNCPQCKQGRLRFAGMVPG